MQVEAAPLPLQNSERNCKYALPDALRTLVALTRRPDDPPRDMRGQVGKDASVEEVLVDTEMDGCRYLLLRMPQPDHHQTRLSPREYEIVRMVAKGHPNKVIADVLNISSWTVCTHLRRIFAKLGVGSRAAMVARLSESGALKGDHYVGKESRGS
jgi:DNA-binding CsgD family transcriptional regulator